MESKKKLVAGLLALFLGPYGAHHFYLGNNSKGVLYLLLSLFTGIGAVVFSIISIIEGIRFLMMSDAEFEAYCANNGVVSTVSSSSPKQPQVDVLDTYNVLKKYKKLLDAGTISQEEFDIIKQKVLD